MTKKSHQLNRFKSALDHVMTALWAWLAVLIATGGWVFPRWELSQTDVFAIVLLLLSLLRGRWVGSPLPAAIEKAAACSSAWISRVGVRRFALGLFAAHATLYFLISAGLYFSFQYEAYDLGFVDQAVWSTAWLSGPASAFHSSLSKGANHLGEHFSPVLGLVSILYRVYPSVLWLFLARAVVISSVILFPVLVSASPRAAWVALAAVFYAPVKCALLFSPREDAFFIPIFLGAFALLWREKMIGVWALAAASLAVKENAGILVMLFSGAVWARGKTRHALGLLGLGLVGMILVNRGIMPRFAGGETSVMVGRLSYWGGSLPAIVRQVFFHPWESLALFFRARVDRGTVLYFTKVFLPLVPLLVFARVDLKRRREWWAGIAALALLFGMNLMITPQKVGFHYELVLVPFLLALVWLGTENLSGSRARRLAVYSGLCLLSVYGRSPVLRLREALPTKAHFTLERALRQIPSWASVTTIGGLYPHLDHRRDATLMNDATKVTEEFVVLSTLKDLSHYGSESAVEIARKLPELGYERKIAALPLLEVWCRPQACVRARVEMGRIQKIVF